MWVYQDSDGRRVTGIRHEGDARHMAVGQGTAQWDGPYRWRVVDNLGHQFVAEIRHVSDRA